MFLISPHMIFFFNFNHYYFNWLGLRGLLNFLFLKNWCFLFFILNLTLSFLFSSVKLILGRFDNLNRLGCDFFLLLIFLLLFFFVSFKLPLYPMTSDLIFLTYDIFYIKKCLACNDTWATCLVQIKSHINLKPW